LHGAPGGVGEGLDLLRLLLDRRARQKLAFTGTGPPITEFQVFSSLGA